MKTAVSISDSLFDRAEKFAKKRKLSRSHLFSEAVKEYIDRREQDEVTANLNAVYGNEASTVDPVLLQMAVISLPNEEW